MLNPWAILGAVVFYIGSVGYGIYFGMNMEETKVKAAQVTAIDQAVSEAKANAEIDYGVQQQLALEAQKHELLKQTNNKKVAKAIAADPASTACRMSDSTFSVLSSSIDAANASASPASASDSAVSGSDQAGRQQSRGSELRAGQHGVDPLDVQTASPTTH